MRKINHLSLVLLLIVATHNAALATPRQASPGAQPVEIKADHLIVQQKKGLATYTGHVIAQQGQFFLYGDRLEVYVKEGKIQQVIAYGTPAKFKKYDLKAKGWTHGKAKRIIYTPAPQKQLKLLNSAQVIQASGESLSSDNIHYLVDSKTLTATGSKQQRVHVIFPTQESK